MSLVYCYGTTVPTALLRLRHELSLLNGIHHLSWLLTGLVLELGSGLDIGLGLGLGLGSGLELGLGSGLELESG